MLGFSASDLNCIVQNKSCLNRQLRLVLSFFAVVVLTLVLTGNIALAEGQTAMPVSAASGTETSSASTPKRVLFLNSYSRDFITVPVVVDQVEQELKGLATLQYLFMNTKNLDLDFAVAQTKRELEYLEGKYGYKFDLIITGDDDALDFVRKYRNEYFKDIPVIFENVNSENKVREAVKDPLMAGLVETFYIKETVQLALKLNPKAQRLVVVTDGTISSKGTDEQIDAVKKDFPQLDFQRLNGSRYTTERLKTILGSYGEETILYFNMLSVDGSGIRYNIANGIKFVSQAAKIPLYKGDEAGIGDGLLGGCVLSYESIGHKAGQMARQVLTGARTPRQLGYAKGEFNYKFDVEMMKRFHIAKSQLPKEAVYVNDPPSFYELHESVLRAAGMLLLLVIILGLLYDRRRNRLFNEQLTQTQAEAKAAELANKAKTDFLSRMSHDIRTPLNAIIGLTSLAQDDLQDPDRMADNLRKIHSSGVILLSLLNDVLDVSRIESGRLVLYPEPYTLPEFLSQIHVMFDNQCKSRGLHFEVLTGGESYTVLLDKVRFVQLIGNLLTNAVKYTPAGGHIKLEVRCGQVETVSGGFPSDKILPCTFIVSDDGAGMTAEFQKKMFEPFTQEGKSKDALTGGSGLGLAIVKTILELMGGTIRVQSAPGQGTRYTLHFRLCLAKEAELDQTEQNALSEQAEKPGSSVKSELSNPNGSAEKSSSSAQADSPANRGSAEKTGLSGSPESGQPVADLPRSASTEAVFTNRRILLVEDHPLNAEIATRMLTKKGIQVELAINGREAVSKFEHSSQDYYDLILMDIRMPVLDGREATKEIRRLHRLDAMTVPIIAMTADAFDGDVNRSLQSGMNDQLNKPVEPKALYGMLEQYWRRT